MVYKKDIKKILVELKTSLPWLERFAKNLGQPHPADPGTKPPTTTKAPPGLLIFYNYFD